MSKIYQDISTRTKGDIYIGVVGPVRTGKSTFIKRFMDICVVPNIENEFERSRAVDELPQSGAGKTIMTTEPKFIPNEAVKIKFDDSASASVRMIDCVGYIVRSALGHSENGEARMVSTPWFEEDIPFDEAAEIGTRKVIREHSTIGLVVTSDGTVCDIAREDYIDAEERVVHELCEINKPFIIILNSVAPHSESAQKLRASLEEKYGVSVFAVSAADLTHEDISEIMESVLFEFPVREIGINMPRWIDALPSSHPLKESIFECMRSALGSVSRIRHVRTLAAAMKQCEYIAASKIESISLGSGCALISLDAAEGLFYKILGETTGFEIDGEDKLICLMRDLAQISREYDKVKNALDSVRQTGYGIVSPTNEEMTLEEPEIVRQGGRFGVRLRASAPSIHMIRADIKTEVSPIVGSERQSEELVHYLLEEFETDPTKIWQSNIFGKSLHELVNEGLHAKLSKMPDEARFKLQETLQKIINEGSGGLICIIL